MVNEETQRRLEESLVEVLDFIGKSAESATNFAIEQAPLVCREIVAWTLWSNIAHLAFAVTMLAVGILSGRRLIGVLREVGDKERDEIEAHAVVRAIIFGLSALLLTLIGFIAVCNSVEPTIKAAVAPRLVILDYIKDAAR